MLVPFLRRHSLNSARVKSAAEFFPNRRRVKFPRIPGFFIVTPIYMISEKAADVIEEDARRSSAP